MKTLVAPHEVSSHLVWPFKVWLILDFLQDLMYWLSEHYVNHLKSRRPRLPSKILSGSIIVVADQPEISPLLKDNLTLPFALLLVLLNPFILINSVLELMHTASRFPNQGFLQTMLGR